MIPKTKDCMAVIIPVYNIASFLEETIKSAVTQSYPHKEVIVVDDGSAEKNAEEIKRICGLFSDVTLLRQAHGGAASARDRGVAHTSAELILFLDADDILLPGSLEYFSNAMHNHPDAVAAYAKALHVDKHGKDINKPPQPSFMPAGRQLLYSLLKRDICLYNGAVCVRKRALKKLSPNNHNMTYGEDWVLWCHLALSGDIIPAGEHVVLHYRKHTWNITNRLWEEPALVFVAYNVIFTHPAFIASIGEEALRALQRECFSGIHFQFASLYARQSNPGKAMLHMRKANMNLSSLFDVTSC